EAELAVRYNVSRNTLRKALSLLEGEGIIHR
ncbi:GntR family transcriptional regulator, partial [Escherichia coli]